MLLRCWAIDQHLVEVLQAEIPVRFDDAKLINSMYMRDGSSCTGSQQSQVIQPRCCERDLGELVGLLYLSLRACGPDED